MRPMNAWFVWFFTGASVLLLAAATFWAVFSSAWFEDKTIIELSSETGAGLSIGMPVIYSGFPIGRLSDYSLTRNGKVRVFLSIPVEDMYWVRRNSQFQLQWNPFGGGSIEVITPDLDAPPFQQDRIIDLNNPNVLADLQNQALLAVQSVQRLLADLTDADNPANFQALQQDAKGILARIDGVLLQFASANSPLDYLTGVEGTGATSNQILSETEQLIRQTRTELVGPSGTLPALRSLLRTTEDRIRQLEPVLNDLHTVSGNAADLSDELQSLQQEARQALSSARQSLQRIESLLGAGAPEQLSLP